MDTLTRRIINFVRINLSRNLFHITTVRNKLRLSNLQSYLLVRGPRMQVNRGDSALTSSCRVVIEAGEHAGEFGYLKSFALKSGCFEVEIEKREWPKFWITYPDNIYVEPKSVRILEGLGDSR